MPGQNLTETYSLTCIKREFPFGESFFMKASRFPPEGDAPWERDTMVVVGHLRRCLDERFAYLGDVEVRQVLVAEHGSMTSTVPSLPARE
jgi:hypothetical protein